MPETRAMVQSLMVGLIRLLLAGILKEVGHTHPYHDIHPIRPVYDFIVVGGGSAGAVVAARLAEEGTCRVLLLESGGEAPLESHVPGLSLLLIQGNADWNYRTVSGKQSLLAFSDDSIPYPRGRVAGGSSTINALIYVRGNRRDFDNWEAMGNPGWSYKDVLPYFKKAENYLGEFNNETARYHGRGGPVSVEPKRWRSPVAYGFLKAGQQLGFKVVDPNGEEQIGFSLLDITSREGRRSSTAEGYIKPAARLHNNLHVALNAHVTKILFNKDKRAVGVSFMQGDKMRTVLAGREVILSAGAIGSPQLLLLSGIGPAAHLNTHGIPVVADVVGVGRNLQDHPSVSGLSWTTNKGSAISIFTMLNPKNIYAYLRHGLGPLSGPVFNEGNAWMPSVEGDPYWPDIQVPVLSGILAIDFGILSSQVIGVDPEVYKDYFSDVLGREGFSMTPFLSRPLSRGTVTLASSDPYAQPLIDVNFFSHPADVTTLVRGIKQALRIGDTPAMMVDHGARFHKKVLRSCQDQEPFTDKYWGCYVRHMSNTAYHPVGTCKMAPMTDPLGVVDHRLRVRGVRGLRVVDASIMPLIVTGNTNAATIMIGEKAADLIKEDWCISTHHNHHSQSYLPLTFP